MALSVGNLLTDPAAQSFISLEDADSYLAAERHVLWQAAEPLDQEAALVRASRWLASAYAWNSLSEMDLLRVGHVAARLAAETVGANIYAGVDTASAVASEKVGSIAVTYRTDMTADVAGLALPWLKAMLRGLIREPASGIGIMVI